MYRIEGSAEKSDIHENPVRVLKILGEGSGDRVIE
jgi:hypothetical protein